MGKRKFFAYDTDREGNLDCVRELTEIQMEDLPFHGKRTEPFLTLTKADFNKPEAGCDLGDSHGHYWYSVKPTSKLTDWFTSADTVAWKLAVYSEGVVVIELNSSDVPGVYVTAPDGGIVYYAGPSAADSYGDFGRLGEVMIRVIDGVAEILAGFDFADGAEDFTLEIFKVTPAKTLAPEVTGFTRVIFSDYNRNDQTLKCSMTAREIMAAACKGPVYGYFGDPDGNIEDIMILPYLGSESAPITAYFGVPDWQMWNLGNDTAPASGVCVTDGEERAKRISRIPA